MTTMRAYVGEDSGMQLRRRVLKDQSYKSICGLPVWVDKNDYPGNDTFVGLNARFLLLSTSKNEFLRMVLHQGVRGSPVNKDPPPCRGKRQNTTIAKLWRLRFGAARKRWTDSLSFLPSIQNTSGWRWKSPSCASRTCKTGRVIFVIADVRDGSSMKLLSCAGERRPLSAGSLDTTNSFGRKESSS